MKQGQQSFSAEKKHDKEMDSWGISSIFVHHSPSLVRAAKIGWLN
jgi:hypothetical protein